LLFNKFFTIVDTYLSCEDIAGQSCAMVSGWRFLAISCVLCISRLGTVTARHSSRESQPTCGVEQTAHSAGRPSRWALALSFFPRLISAVTDWMSTIVLHGVALVRI